MVQHSCPPAMAGAVEHSGHASAGRVGKARASEGEDAGMDGECLGQLDIRNGSAEARQDARQGGVARCSA
jgi:hypothetical protein